MKRSELFFTFILLPIDFAMIMLAFVVAYKFRLSFEFVPAIYFQPFNEYLKFALMVSPVWLLVFALTGLYTRDERKTVAHEFGRIIVAVSAAIALTIALIFLSRTYFFSRLIIVYSAVAAVITVTLGRNLIRYIQRWLYHYDIGVRRVIVLGHNSSTKFIITEIKENRRLGYKFVKAIDHDGIDKIESIVKNNPCDEIIVSDANLDQRKVAKVLEFCQLNGIGFKMTPNLFLVSSSHVDVQQLAGVPVMEFKRTPLDGWGRILKRVMDIIVSLILIIIFSPIMLVIALLVKLTSKGPVFYRPVRVGLEKNFIMFKFRSMKVDAEKEHEAYIKKYGNMFKLKDDPRVTSFGKILRKTSLDELPQFFNVLKGDMSLIGPRPPMPEEVEKYTNWQKRRLGVKPGITGLWQVSGRSNLSFDEWVRLDAYYIEHWSMWLDLQIFFKTIWVVLFRRGAY